VRSELGAKILNNNFGSVLFLVIICAESTQLSTKGPSHNAKEGINWARDLAQPTQDTDVLVEVPVIGCSVTAFNEGLSAELKVTFSSWNLANTSRATMAGEGAEQEYDTKGILNLFSQGQCVFLYE
jgi:hypothetical protein